MTIQNITAQLPFVDISRFHGSAQERQAFIEDLKVILHDHGFFYLVGHGVDPQLIAEVVAASKRFFALPLEEKLKIEMVKSPHFRGYNRAGYERTRGQQDWREQLDINTEGEPVEIGPDTPAWKRLFGPNQWPDALPELKPLLLAYQAEVTRIGIDVLKAIAVALGQPEDVFAEIYEPQPSQLLKIIRYPGREVAETDQGVGAHKDGGFVTVLLQDTVPACASRRKTASGCRPRPCPAPSSSTPESCWNLRPTASCVPTYMTSSPRRPARNASRSPSSSAPAMTQPSL
ncbi:non-haem dioxygenase, N-terminal [Rhizobium sp. RU36D]|nr:non-haem dioxygenase, N-terminal [Rhizobium sp. RU36D]